MAFYIIIVFIALFSIFFSGSLTYGMPITGMFSDDHRYIENNYGTWECIQGKELHLKEETPEIIKQDLLKNNDCSSNMSTRISKGFMLGSLPIILTLIILITGIFAGINSKNREKLKNG